MYPLEPPLRVRPATRSECRPVAILHIAVRLIGSDRLGGLRISVYKCFVRIWLCSYGWCHSMIGFIIRKVNFFGMWACIFSTGTVTAGSPLVRNRSLEVCVRCRQIGSLPVAVRLLLHCDGLKAHRRLGWWGALSSAIHWCMQPRQAQLKKLILRCRLLSWLGWSCFHPDCFAALLLNWHQFDGFES